MFCNKKTAPCGAVWLPISYQAIGVNAVTAAKIPINRTVSKMASVIAAFLLPRGNTLRVII